jgi:hypothetical protein
VAWWRGVVAWRGGVACAEGRSGRGGGSPSTMIAACGASRPWVAAVHRTR